MRRIGEPEMCEGVCHQQVAEFVVNAWSGNRQTRKKGKPNGYNRQKEQQTAEKTASRDWLSAFPYHTRDCVAGFSEERLQKQQNAAADYEVMESASQRLQIGRVGANDRKHDEDDTSGRAGTKIVWGLALDLYFRGLGITGGCSQERPARGRREEHPGHQAAG